MFGSSPFGQSNTSPFGTQSVFGQNNNANNNPFAPKPFGSPTTPFGAQTGGSLFGGTSTGVFGATQSSSPLGSTPVFGANSSPAFGASSTPAFGTTAFGQKPAFSGFGTNNTQTAPFGGTFQPTQSAFGTNNNMFGSTTPSPFNAQSQPAFGTQQSQPAFGTQQSQSAFGTTNTSPFGTTNTPNFGNTGSGFGVSAPFGVTSTTPNFGATTSGFGVSASVPAFGTATTSAFGTTTSAFGNTSSTPGFNTSSSAPFSFGQTSSAFNSSPFGTTTPSPSPFGAPTTPFGTQQPTTPSFGNTTFGQQSTFNNGPRVGSRVTPYTPTPDQDSNGTQPAGKLESISAMPAYKDKSHEELRWEDYQAGDKGGPNPAGQTTNTTPSFGNGGFNTTSTTAFGQTQTQTAANPFSTTANNPFAAKTPTFNTGFGSNTTPTISSSTFGAIPSPSPFATQPVTSSPFGTPQTSQPFGNNNSPSIFGTSSASGFGTNTSLFGSTSAQVSTPTFGQTGGFGQTMSSPLFQSTPLIGQNNNTGFGQNSTGFGQNSTGFGQSSTGFGQNSTGFGQTTSTFGQNNMFSTPNTGFNTNLFSGAQSNGFGQTTPSLSTPFQQTQPAQTGGAFGTFSTFGNTQIGANNTSGFGNTSNMFGQNTFGQQTANPSQTQAVAPPVQITNPFGTLPAMPQMSIGRTGTSPSIQYGISNLPVVDKPNPVRISSLLTSRHLSQRRIRLPARKYNPKSDGPKVAFFSDEEETPSNPKADALFIPRENPRALVIRPLDQWPAKASAEKSAPLNHTSSPGHENGNGSEAVPNPTMNGFRSEDKDTEGSNDNGVAGKKNPKQNGTHEAGPQKGDSYITLTGHRAGEAAIVYEHGADIEALMPKLRHSDYYTEPRIQELAAKERAEPGFCRRVKDFVVGRNGYGSIKFIGETDVRRLDLETLIQFNNREVIVYMDESKKPPIGQGLNKRAEVTLLNIKCIDKRSGEQYTEGPRIEKYKEMLKKKANDQGAEFLLYDPVKGEWKFRVEHFSCYKLDDDEDEDLNV